MRLQSILRKRISIVFFFSIVFGLCGCKFSGDSNEPSQPENGSNLCSSQTDSNCNNDDGTKSPGENGDNADDNSGGTTSPTPVPPHSTPTPTPVQCSTGYERDSATNTCLDIDECNTGAAGCSAHLACTNTPGSFTCGCSPGFFDTGTACQQICATNYCTTYVPSPTIHCVNGNQNCQCGDSAHPTTCSIPCDQGICRELGDNSATCSNDQVTCTCSPGYTFNGISCAPNPTLSCNAAAAGAASGGSNINCNGSSPCSSQTITCTAGQNCQISCNGVNSCANATINCPDGYDCRVQCETRDACKDLTFGNLPSGNLEIICQDDGGSDDTCSGTFACPEGQGSCKLTSLPNASTKDLTLSCGTKGACAMECQAAGCVSSGNQPILECKEGTCTTDGADSSNITKVCSNYCPCL